jgi:hypothetical protein
MIGITAPNLTRRRCPGFVRMLTSASRIRDGLHDVHAQGAAFVSAALRPGVTPGIAQEVSSGNFERLAEYEGTARQDGEFFVVTGDMSRYPLTACLCRELTAVVHQQGSEIDGLRLWYPNQAWVQRYRPGSRGITVHKDLKRHALLVAVFTLEGSAAFTVCKNRAGDAWMSWAAGPGSLVLLRGPGFDGTDDDRPLHAVGGPGSGQRVSLTFRMDSNQKRTDAAGHARRADGGLFVPKPSS